MSNSLAFHRVFIYALTPLLLVSSTRLKASEELVDSTPAPPTWVDRSHSYVLNRSQDLAQWMDDFFGVPDEDAERAESFARLIFLDDWNARDSHRFRVRVRGQLQLPKLSERIDLLFSGEETDTEAQLSGNDSDADNDLSLRFNLSETSDSRIDLTASIRGGPALLPGVRFRHQDTISENASYRFTQRFQFHTDDGYRSTSNLIFHRYLSERSSLRWGNTLRYREENEYWEWRTGLSYRSWLSDHHQRPSAIEYFVRANGIDDPEFFARNYSAGVLYRKRVYRDFLYYELEPSYNLRRDEFDQSRSGVWGFTVRLEIMLEKDLRQRSRSSTAN